MRLATRPDGHLDYSEIIDPLAARPLALQLAGPYAARTGYWSLTQAIILYEYVRSFGYFPDPIGLDDFVQPPAVTFETRAGNCEAKAVALVSLFRAAGIPSRLMLISDGVRVSHLMTQVFIGPSYDLSGLPAELASLGAPSDIQRKYIGVAPRQLTITDDDGQRYLLVDPTISDFAGQLELHVPAGLVSSWAPGSFTFQYYAVFSDGADRSENILQAAARTLDTSARSVDSLLPASYGARQRSAVVDLLPRATCAAV
jgi:hypothetical protein